MFLDVDFPCLLGQFISVGRCRYVAKERDDEKCDLDRAEGLGRGYDSRDLRLATDQGTRDAFAYVANPAWIDDSLRPYHWYKEYVLRGAREFGLPGRYIDEYIESVPSVEDPDARRARENRRLLGLR
ncbi:MAG: gamma-glutamylcyclotransferase [Acidobacteriota bacterium]